MPKEVREALCVGQRRPQDLDERVVLFLLMRDGVKLDKEMVRRVKAVIGEELTKRHVPKYVFEVKDIPVSHPCQSRRGRIAVFILCREHHLVRVCSSADSYCHRLRLPSTGRKSSYQSSTSFPGGPSSQVGRCLTQGVWTSFTSSRRLRSWRSRGRNCEREPRLLKSDG